MKPGLILSANVAKLFVTEYLFGMKSLNECKGLLCFQRNLPATSSLAEKKLALDSCFLGNDDYGLNYADNTFRYRQDSSFLYYFGLSMLGFLL